MISGRALRCSTLRLVWGMGTGHTEDVVIVRGTVGMPQSAVMWPLADYEASHTAEMNLPSRSSGVPQLLIQDTLVRRRSRR